MSYAFDATNEVAGSSGLQAVWLTSAFSPYEANGFENLILCDVNRGDIEVKLPHPRAALHAVLSVKRVALEGCTDLVLVQPSAGARIDNDSSKSLAKAGDFITVYSDGDTWHVVG
jgi:hypothetical protein